MQAVWNTRVVRLGAPLIWMGFIFFLSSQSDLPSLTPQLPGFQEIAGHLSAFAVLAWLWWLALRGMGVRYAALWALLITVLYGVSDEFHQSFVPNRVEDIFDLAMDTLGASVALVLANLLANPLANLWVTIRRAHRRGE